MSIAQNNVSEREAAILCFFEHQVSFDSKLGYMLSNYVTPLLSSDSDHIMTQQQHQMIFSNIHEIAKLQTQFVDTLKSNCDLTNGNNNHKNNFYSNLNNNLSNNLNKFGVIVYQWTSHFDVYLNYFKNYKAGIDLFEQLGLNQNFSSFWKKQVCLNSFNSFSSSNPINLTNSINYDNIPLKLLLELPFHHINDCFKLINKIINITDSNYCDYKSLIQLLTLLERAKGTLSTLNFQKNLELFSFQTL